MKRLTLIFLIAGVATGCEARAIGSLAEVAIVDRENGMTLPVHYFRGEYWIAGRPGDHYAIEIHNRLGERILAVSSVDGVNVVSGESAGWNQTGYVFSPDERYRIAGWRKSDAEIAAFTFTSSPNSYAEKTGRPANVGIIGVALFRERVAPPVYAYTTPLNSAPPEAFQGGQPREETSRQDSGEYTDKLARSKLGTGHGERESSPVMRTDFERRQPQPNEVIHIRYDSVDNLVAMGVIAAPRHGYLRVDPFPLTPTAGFVPDPPG